MPQARAGVYGNIEGRDFPLIVCGHHPLASATTGELEVLPNRVWQGDLAISGDGAGAWALAELR